MSFSFGSNKSLAISCHRVLFFLSTTYELEMTSTPIQDRYVSQEDEPDFPTQDFYIDICLLGFPEIGTHAFSPGNSWGGAQGHSYGCGFGSQL